MGNQRFSEGNMSSAIRVSFKQENSSSKFYNYKKFREQLHQPISICLKNICLRDPLEKIRCKRSFDLSQGWGVLPMYLFSEKIFTSMHYQSPSNFLMVIQEGRADEYGKSIEVIRFKNALLEDTYF